VSNAAPDEPEPEPGRGRRLSPAARRAQLLTVAERVFTRHGYQGTSMEDIATAAGITRPLIYNYFTDKDELYLECLRRARTELETAIVQAALAQHEPGEQLRSGLGAYFAFVKERGHRWDMLFGGGTAVAGTVAEEAAALRFGTAEKIAALVHAAAPQLPTTTTDAYAHLISGAGEQLAKWWRRNPHVPIADLVTWELDVIWIGLDRITGSRS
jgi:AcrR family transcriptional regulator